MTCVNSSILDWVTMGVETAYMIVILSMLAALFAAAKKNTVEKTEKDDAWVNWEQ